MEMRVIEQNFREAHTQLLLNLEGHSLPNSTWLQKGDFSGDLGCNQLRFDLLNDPDLGPKVSEKQF